MRKIIAHKRYPAGDVTIVLLQVGGTLDAPEYQAYIGAGHDNEHIAATGSKLFRSEAKFFFPTLVADHVIYY